jgi:hypothetical protein
MHRQRAEIGPRGQHCRSREMAPARGQAAVRRRAQAEAAPPGLRPQRARHARSQRLLARRHAELGPQSAAVRAGARRHAQSGDVKGDVSSTLEPTQQPACVQACIVCPNPSARPALAQSRGPSR